MKTEESKINFILPEFRSFSRNEIFLNIYDKHKYLLREDTSIYSFFGSFPNCIWNGGGLEVNYENSDVKEMIKVRDFYNKKGIKITFTFTNSLIEEQHLNNVYANQILKIFDNGFNEVLIVSPILEEYIRKNYPNYKINRSIINTEKVPYLLGDYHLSVLSKFKNKDFDFIKSLSPLEISKTEILCDEHCVNNCPYAYEHYKEYAYIQLNDKMPEKHDKFFATCRFSSNPHEFLKTRYMGSSYRISYDDMINTYAPLGIKYYKLSGRGRYNTNTLMKFIEYMIKPEYKMDVRTYIAERMILDAQEDAFKELKTVGSLRIDNQNFEYV